MKVGIMSMQRIVNYGSYLQAYGLKQMIEELGANVVYVDYHAEKCIHDSNKIAIKRILKRTKLWKLLRKYVLKRPEAKIPENEQLFMSAWKNIGITDNKNYRPKLDLLVIGSDEVFNCLQTNPDVGYSPELFGKNNRSKGLVSYAASFGNTTLARLREYNKDKEIAKYLKRFDAISVRDENSGKTVEQLTKIKPHYHLDPVLVGDFSNIIQDNVNLSNFIIVYGYGNRFSVEEGDAIIQYAKKYRKKVITMCGKQSFCDEHIDCSPYEVLSYFNHADAVITDTFHGSIFSIITHCPFVTVIRESVNGSYGNREKLEDMLIRMQMQSRIIVDMSDIETVMNQSPNFEATDQIRKRERENAIEYLRKYIC